MKHPRTVKQTVKQKVKQEVKQEVKQTDSHLIAAHHAESGVGADSAVHGVVIVTAALSGRTHRAPSVLLVLVCNVCGDVIT